MVRQYLEKLQDELFIKKIEISNQILDLNNQYKESVEMIKLLEESDDPTFDVFTPREVNNFNRLKVEELKYSQISILHDIDVKKQELNKVEADITEINVVLKTEISTLQNIKALSEKVEKCYDLVVLERYQCKIELAEMKKMIDKMLKNI